MYPYYDRNIVLVLMVRFRSRYTIRKLRAFCPDCCAAYGYKIFIVYYIGRSTEKMMLRSDRVSITPQLSSQLSNTPYEADSPKRYVAVIVEETKRIPSLTLQDSKTLSTVTGLRDLNQRLLKRKEETHPCGQIPLPNS